MFPGNFFGPHYYAPRYFPRPQPIAPPLVSSGGSSGHPWPQKLINILLPKQVTQDDEDILLIL